MKILVVPIELPLPANSGGRIDVSRRLSLLKAGGHDVALMTWHNVARDGALGATQLAGLHSLCSTHHVSLIHRSLTETVRRFSHLWHLPSHVAARWVSLNRPAVLAWARKFSPDVLLLDGLYGVAAVRWLAEQLSAPWVYRSHNIEHVYMQQQRARARSWQARAGLAANLLGLRRVEEATVRNAAWTYDISVTDAVHWRECGCDRVQWLPTVVDAAFEQAMSAAASRPPLWDIVYFGNLNTPNNVQAVEWFVEQVLPLIQGAGLRVAIAGSRPTDAVRALSAADRRITLLADPPAIEPVAGAARVLVNPVQAGSGVNLKSVEMLFSAAHLVSTPAGVQGLPEPAAACFDVHADPAAFAAAVVRALRAPLPPAAPRLVAREAFTPAGASRVLAETLGPMLSGRK